MSTDIIRRNINVRVEILNLYDNEISTNKNEDRVNFIKNEREKILHLEKMDSGFFKGKIAPSAWNYFTGYSDGETLSVVKWYMSFMAYHFKTNESLLPQTLEYIDYKIGTSYNLGKKLIKKLNKRKAKLNSEMTITHPNHKEDVID